MGGLGRRLSTTIDCKQEFVLISQLYVAIKGNRQYLLDETKSAPIAQRQDGQKSVAKMLCCGVVVFVSTEGRNYGGTANVDACFFSTFSHCQENYHR